MVFSWGLRRKRVIKFLCHATHFTPQRKNVLKVVKCYINLCRYTKRHCGSYETNESARDCQYSPFKINVNRNTTIEIRLVLFPSIKHKLSHDWASAFVNFFCFRRLGKQWMYVCVKQFTHKNIIARIFRKEWPKYTETDARAIQIRAIVYPSRKHNILALG